jgi:hypothetical protein
MEKFNSSKITYNKTIRILEPFDGWVHHGYDNPNEASDTGLCNRLFYWQSVFNLNEKYNSLYTLCVEKIWWPELDLFELPNTVAIDYPNYTFKDYKKKLKYDFISKCGTYSNDSDIVNQLNVVDDINTDINHFYTSFDFEDIKEFTPFPKFKFKYKFIEEIIKKYINIHTTGVHIRRGNGMCVPEIGDVYTDEDGIFGIVDVEDLNCISKLNITQFNLSGEEVYIPNSYYKKIFNNLLNSNPRKKIFISSDIPIELLKEIIEPHADRIFTSTMMVNEITNELKNKNVIFDDLQYRYIIKNVVDLFSLTYCGDFVPYPNSSWSRFVLLYSNI